MSTLSVSQTSRTTPQIKAPSWIQNPLKAAARHAASLYQAIASKRIFSFNWQRSAVLVPSVPAASASIPKNPDPQTSLSRSEENDVVNEKPREKGIFTLLDGAIYEGEVADGKLHGKGKLTYPSGMIYEGDFVNSQFSGKGKVTLVGGEFYASDFINGRVKSNFSDLGTLHFLKCLIGISKQGIPSTFVLGILSDYLKKEGYLDLGENLESAALFSELPKDEIPNTAQTILENIRRSSQFLDYGSKAHTMPLNITHNFFSEFVFFEIFNSGDGLHLFHQTHPTKSKYQTKLVIKAPLKNLTAQKIEELLENRHREDARSAYEAILSISGAEIAKSAPETAIWQAPQKGRDCSIKAIFVYLRHQMSKDDYDRMRIEFFRDCIAAGHRENPGHPEMQQIEDILRKKIAKREARLSAAAISEEAGKQGTKNKTAPIAEEASPEEDVPSSKRQRTEPKET
jgi:hypothetical protein